MTQTKAELLQTRHQGDIRLGDANSSNYVGFKAPATVGSNQVWTLPAADGSPNYLLKTDGSGTLAWTADNTGVSLSGSTNNTIVTVTGANALQGEGNLTFDGNNLSQAIDNSGEGIRITASGNHYSVLKFDSNVSSAGGSLCNIQGHWNGSEVANIIFAAGDDTSNKDDGIIKFHTTTSGGSSTERMRVSSDGELLINLTSGAGIATDANLQVRGATHLRSKIQVLGTHNDDNPASLVIAKSRGSGNVILGDNDDIGQLDFAGNDGNGFHTIGRIAVTSSGEGNGDDDLPTVMRFFTTGNGGVTNSERMRIDSSGKVGIGDTAPDALLSIKGDSNGDSNPSIRLKDGTDTRECWMSNVSGDLYLAAGGNDNVYHTRIRLMDGNAIHMDTGGTNALSLDSSQNATFASAIYGPVKTVSALQLDLSTGNYFIKTISGNSTFTFANPAASGTVTAFTLELTHSSGSVTWPSSVKWNADTAPTLTTGKTHLFMFVTDDGGSRYRGSALIDYVN